MVWAMLCRHAKHEALSPRDGLELGYITGTWNIEIQFAEPQRMASDLR